MKSKRIEMITKEELKDLVEKCSDMMKSDDHDVRMKTAALDLSISADRLCILFMERELSKKCLQCGAFQVPVEETSGKELYIFCSNCGSTLGAGLIP